LRAVGVGGDGVVWLLWFGFLLYAHRHRSILGLIRCAAHITKSTNQILVSLWGKFNMVTD
jgi:hypothetical protein